MNRIILASLAVLTLAGAARAQVVFTENFESPTISNYQTYISGQTLVTAANTWSITANSIDLFNDSARTEAAAFDLGQAVDLTGSPGEGVMHAFFPTTPGTQYSLVFYYARNNNIGSDTADAQVDILGSAGLLSATVQHSLSNFAFDSYQQFQGTFTADSATSMIRFTSLDPGIAGVTIDGISITAVPAPASATLLGTFLAASFRRRTR